MTIVATMCVRTVVRIIFGRESNLRKKCVKNRNKKAIFPYLPFHGTAALLKKFAFRTVGFAQPRALRVITTVLKFFLWNIS